MDDCSLVPVDHQPDFEDYSLVPVDHDPFSADAVTQQAQSQQAQTELAQSGPQPAAGIERFYVSPPAGNTRASKPIPSIASTTQPPAPTQVAHNGIPQARPPSGLTPNVVTPQQLLRGAINQFYPGAQFSGLAQQAYKNGQYGNAIGYGVGAIADSLLALGSGKLLGAGIAAGVDALRGIAPSSRALRRALEAAGQARQTGDAAHHIVAGTASAAAAARATLQRLGIGINDVANGVFLRGAKHASVHTTEYYEAVNKALANTTSKAEAEQILQSIGQRLQSDNFP